MARRESFTLDVSRWAERAGEKVDAVVKKTVFDLFSEIVMRTPVDTGRARANWQIGINQEPRSSLANVDKDGAVTLSIGATMIEAAPKGDCTFYITNNLNYIIPLEYGWSKQAPAGMVRISVASFHNFVEQAIASDSRNPLK